MYKFDITVLLVVSSFEFKKLILNKTSVRIFVSRNMVLKFSLFAFEKFITKKRGYLLGCLLLLILRFSYDLVLFIAFVLLTPQRLFALRWYLIIHIIRY